MSYVRSVEAVTTEPVSLDEAKTFLKLTNSAEDTLIRDILIPAAREQAEIFTNLSIAKRKWAMNLDSFPYYVDTIQSQQAYPPNYYSNPRYSTTLWNYSQQIRLYKSPLNSVEDITYVGTDRAIHTLAAFTDFVVDPATIEARLFPLPGKFWPSVLYTPNAVEIHFTSGYDPDPTKILTINVPGGVDGQQQQYVLAIGIPRTLKTTILMLVAHYYFNREPVVAGTAGEIPMHLKDMLWSYRIEDVSPTRG